MTVYINGTTGYSGPVGTIGDLTTTGNTTLGDAAGDTVTINGSTTTFTQGTANGVAYLNGSKVLTTGTALVFDGNGLTLGGSAPRLLSNMSGGQSTRFGIQNSTTNGNTRFYLYPNGTGNISAINMWNNSDPAAANYSSFDLGIIGTSDIRFSSSAAGTASYLPFTWYMASEIMRLDANGNLGLNTASPSNYTNYKTLTIAGTTGGVIDLVTGSTIQGQIVCGTNEMGIGAVAASGVLTLRSGGNFERARIDASGNFLVGGTSTSALSGVSGISVGSTSISNAGIGFCTSGRQYLFGTIAGSPYANSLIIYDSTAVSERFRINPSGYVKANVNGTFHDSAAVYHEFNQPASGVNSVILRTTSASPYGPWIFLSGAAPNNATNYFLAGTDSSVTRFYLYSNGGLANYQANNSNLSDRREKTNFAPAGSYLEKICAIPVQTFNYIDQNMEEDGGLTLGVVAQDVQAVAPELVTESDWGTKEEPKMRLSIYQTDLQYALMKALQELKAEFDAYKLTHP